MRGGTREVGEERTSEGNEILAGKRGYVIEGTQMKGEEDQGCLEKREQLIALP